MRISVVILTHNRASLLNRCLASVDAQERLADQIVVVDNASTDATASLLARRAALAGEGPAGQAPLLVVAGDPACGWAAARNQGVQAATGDWVAFLDDDCEAPPRWLAVLEAVAGEGFDAVGGVAEPADPLRYPWWWHGEMAWAAGLSVPAQFADRTSGAVHYPSTSNLAVRRDVLLAEPFQEIAGAALASAQEGGHPAGRGAALYGGGREDAELWRRLRRSGRRCVCDPAFRVRHHVPQDRLRWRSIVGRAHQDGLALQRREPRAEYLGPALDTLWRLPAALALGVWRGSEAPWREAAWRLVWAARQAGQWRAAFLRSAPATTWLFPRLLLAAVAGTAWGAAKRSLRAVGVAVWRARRHLGRVRRGRRTFLGSAPRSEISVAVAAAGYLGDLALLHPFLTGLKEQRPAVRLTLITNGKGQELYAHEPAVDHLVAVGGPGSTPASDSQAIREALARHRVQVLLVPYWYRVAPGALFSRPEARVVTFAEEVGFPRRWWYDLADRRIPKPTGEHEGAHLYRLFREAGFEGRLPQAPWAFLAEEVDAVAEFARTAGLSRDNLAIVAPGSAKSPKCWPNERWAEVVRYLSDEYSLRVCLVGSEGEQALCGYIAGLAGRDALVLCGWNLRREALLLSGARLVVGSDNGVKHLAAAVDTPTLTLFGPTDERQWGAIRHPGRHGVVRGCAWDLTAEERAGLPPDHQMRCIGTARVLAALDEMLAED